MRKISVATLIAVGVFVVGVISLTWFWPFIDYALFRVGLTSPISISNVEIVMHESWYLSMSSERGMGRWLMHTTRPTVVARKLPEAKQQGLVISISKLSNQEAQKLKSPGLHVVETRTMPWGTAAILVGKRAVFVPEFEIVISDDERATSYLLDALQDVRSIKSTK